jgi:hypothetical protein
MPLIQLGGGGGSSGEDWPLFTPILFSASGGDTIPTFDELIGWEKVVGDYVFFKVSGKHTSGGSAGSGSGQLGIGGFSYDVLAGASIFCGTGVFDIGGGAVYVATPYAEDLVAGVYVSRTFSIGGAWSPLTVGSITSTPRSFYLTGFFPKGLPA